MYFDRLATTIAALATASGSSIGIIRISGPKALEIASQLTGKKCFTRNKAAFVSLTDTSGSQLLDQCLCLFFKAPASFTGEDIIEFHVHGAALQAHDILQTIFAAGAIPALPGEFSFRAVINKKINLPEAIGLSAIIAAQDHTTLDFARKESFENRFFDRLSSVLDHWESFHVLATGIVDFPDQIDEYLPFEKLMNLATNTEEILNSILRNSEDLHRLTHFSVVLAGKPNVGKSSLFNILLDKNRAIVSETSGTTRDYLSEKIVFENIGFELIDTAGVRQGQSDLEIEGIEKSLSLINNKDFVIFVRDGSVPFNHEDASILSRLSSVPHVTVINKIDKNLIRTEIPDDAILVSAKTGFGIELLKKTLVDAARRFMPDPSVPVFLSTWQKETADKVLQEIKLLVTALEQKNTEIISFLISRIVRFLSDLTGKTEETSVYEKIFSQFCVGK